MTIPELLRRWAKSTPDAPALMAPGREPLSYRQLFEQTEAAAGQLRSLGVGSDDRVALVHQNGPELAAAFLAISSAAVCAPLNPSYRQSEYDFYIADLHAKFVVLAADDDSPLRDFFRRRGLLVVDVVAAEGFAAGTFRFSEGRGRTREPRENDTALVLHTSGTTARPKIVPLTHRPAHAVRPQRRVDAGADATGSLPQRHAPLPHSRPRGGASCLALRRRERHLHARLPRAVVPRLAVRASSRPGTRRCRQSTRRCSHGSSPPPRRCASSVPLQRRCRRACTKSWRRPSVFP